MNLEYREYRTRRIVNVHKHVDGPWFWTKYSAHPYVGCRSGCEFCYLRGGRYLGRRSPDTLSTLIQVKVNSVERLRVELLRLAPEIINAGDWQQPAESRYRLSRSTLDVVLEFGFTLLVIERSPLLTRDLDLLTDINRKTWAGIILSISSLDPRLKRAFEPNSPGVKRRLQTMAQLADRGLTVGTALMPILPFAGDDEAHLEDVVRATADNGGAFVLAGGLTMSGAQADRTLGAATALDPSLGRQYRELYRWDDSGEPQYGPPREYARDLGIMVRDL